MGIQAIVLAQGLVAHMLKYKRSPDIGKIVSLFPCRFPKSLSVIGQDQPVGVVRDQV